MNEYVKALKVVHQLLILAAAAVVAFALTPDLDLQYKRADEVLAFLQTLSPDSWDRYVSRLLKQEQVEQSHQIIRVLRAADPKVSDRLTIVPYAYTDLRYPLSGGLLDTVRYLKSEQSLRTVTLIIDRQSLLTQLERFAGIPTPPGNNTTPVSDQRQKAHVHVIGMTLVPPGGSYSGQPGGPHLIPLDGISPGDIAPTLTIFIDPESISPVLNLNGGARSSLFMARQRINADRPNHYALDWLKEQDREAVLFKPPDSVSPEPLTSLSPFMVTIGGMSPSQARAKLQEDREAQHGKLSVFGLSVQANLAVNVMPWITLGVIAFFITHLRQMILSSEHLHKVSEGAWVGLFDDWTAKAISAVTILILPTLANLLLVIRHGEEGSRALHFASVALIGALSIWSYAEFLRLRKTVQTLKGLEYPVKANQSPVGNKGAEPL